MKTIYLSLLLFLFSCNSNDDSSDNCIEFHQSPVETVTPKPNTDISEHLFDVAFRCFNGCGNFGSFEETRQGNIITIQVIAKYKGCYCTEDTPLRETVYTFSETTPGTYTLQFKMTEDNYVTQIVVVE